MRVLMFGWEFPPHISGGLGTACFGITKGLSALGDVEILFVVPKAYGDENQSNIRLIAAGDQDLAKRRDLLQRIKKTGKYMEVESRLIPYMQPEKLKGQAHLGRVGSGAGLNMDSKGKLQFSGAYGADLFAEISNYALTAEVIASAHDFDVIHAHDWLTYPAGIAAKRTSGKPLIVHVHATDFDRGGGKANPEVYEIERSGMEKADKVITVSKMTREAVIRRYQIDSRKVICVYNAVDQAGTWNELQKGIGSTEKIVTFLGRITLQKGPEYFVHAANRVLKTMDKVRFVMAGSGDMMNEMVLLVSRLGISHRFHFPGFLRGDEVRQMLQRSDLYVMPSVSEPFGISPLEAMQAGVPVIISKQSGVSEVLSHAIKVDFWDVDAMADAIHAVLSYKSLSRMLSVNGKKQVGGLHWEDSAKQLYSIYKNLLIA